MDSTQLAQTAAAAIVSAMAGDAWQLVRNRIAALFGGGDSDRAEAEIMDLEDTRRTLASADERQLLQLKTELEAEMRGRLRERLRNDPSFAAQLAALLVDLRTNVEPSPPATNVHLDASADRGSTVIQAGRDIKGDIQPPGRLRPDRPTN